MVGAVRFELTTSCTRNKRASHATLRPEPETQFGDAEPFMQRVFFLNQPRQASRRLFPGLASRGSHSVKASTSRRNMAYLSRRTPNTAMTALVRILLPLLHIAAASPVWVSSAASLPPPVSRTVSFVEDVRPILESRCFSCHGPEKQKADLRLDRRSSALKGGESGPAIVPGQSAESRLIQRVTDAKDDQVMPPKGDRLTAEQVGILRAWVDQGVSWPDSANPEDASSKHWSFEPVRRPALPASVSTRPQTGRGTSPIDVFVRARLTANGLELSPEATRTTLIRRLHLVMLGVPPTPEEVAAFVKDPGPDAYERLVDRVLADERYGERWGRHWLDVVRFAESNGFETNRERPNAWRYRDYVIAAFNQDLPFNRFIREQVAGDALGVEVATGFLVGGPVDIVGSPDPVLTAQQRADELDDMVNTTGTAFLGLTLGCARCHTHKFDPIEHREYYAMAAVFSGVRHGERALALPPERAREVEGLDVRIADLERRLTAYLPKAQPLDPGSTGTVKPAALRPPVNARTNTEAFAPIEARYLRFTILATTGGEPCLDELEVYSAERNVALAAGGTKASASGTLPGFEIHKLDHIHDGLTGNSHSWISDQAGQGWVQLEFAQPFRIDRIVWGRDRLGQFADRLATQYRIEAATEPGAWQVIASSADRQAPSDAATGSPAKLPPTYRFDGLPEAEAAQGRAWLAELEAVRKQRESAAKPPMIYAGTFSQPKPTHRLHRGDPMQQREEVVPATLSIFRPVSMAADEPEQKRRVQLADWLASDDNPLTPRVVVNRLWQHHFGVGLVDTPNDFGRNGSRPSHPELLDWLASELVAQRWSVKSIQRQILLSATWRQSSAPRPEAVGVDAGSRLLWRFPPRRLEAEAIRDSILHLSGALDSSRGGPSFHLHDVDRENVYHYHPKDEFGPSEYRRMVYAYKVRMEQDAIFGSFDCPDGSLVVPRRNLSTTALQALNLFNSRFVLQQSEILSERLQREAGSGSEARIQRAWQLAYNRDASPPELREALAFSAHHGFPALGRALFNSNEFLFVP